MLRIIALVCLVGAGYPCTTAYAQFGMDSGTPQGRPILMPRLYPAFDILNFKDSSAPDSSRVDFYLAVPYSELTFLYAGNKYAAEYSVGIRISERGAVDHHAPSDEHSSVVRDLFTSYSILESAAERHAGGSARADAEQLSFRLAPGNDYVLHFTLRDSYGHRDFDTSFVFQVKRWERNRTSMSDLLLYRERMGMNIIPAIGSEVSSLEARATRGVSSSMNEVRGIFAELYNMPASSTLGIVTEVTSSDSEKQGGTVVFRSVMPLRTAISHQAEETVTAPSSAVATPMASIPVFLPLDTRRLWFGRYELRVYVLSSMRDTDLSDPSELSRRAIAAAMRPIQVSLAQGIPISLADVDQAIQQIRIIATDVEWDSLSSARTLGQKQEAFLGFWSQKEFSSSPDQRGIFSGGNRAMEVFYSRIGYANAQFSNGFGSGWESDRGRVYIALGAPDHIEDYPGGYSPAFGGMQRPYQVWAYSQQQVRYVFVDDYGMGDYRLRGAFPPVGTFRY